MTRLTKIHKKQLIQNDALLPNITLKIFLKNPLKTFPDFSRVKSKLQRVRASLIPPVSPLKKMTLTQGHGTPLGLKQTLCEVRTTNVSPSERYGPYTNFEQTDGRPDGQSNFYKPPKLCLRGVY